MRFVIVAIVVMKRREYKSISVFHWYTVGFRRWILNSSRLLISLTSMSWKAAWWTRQCIRFHATSHVYIHMCIYRDMVSIWWVANTGICLLPASFVHIYIYILICVGKISSSFGCHVGLVWRRKSGRIDFCYVVECSISHQFHWLTSQICPALNKSNEHHEIRISIIYCVNPIQTAAYGPIGNITSFLSWTVLCSSRFMSR